MRYLVLLSISFFLFFCCNSTDESSILEEQNIEGTWKLVLLYEECCGTGGVTEGDDLNLTYLIIS